MKKTLLALLLAAQLSVFGQSPSYQNNNKKPLLDYVIENATTEKTPSGILPIEFEAFKEIGFNYKLLGDMSQDLNKTKLAVSEPSTKSYVAQDKERVIFIDTIQQFKEEEKVRAIYLIQMKTDKCNIAVDFKAFPEGTNTGYNAKVYVRPEGLGARVFLKILTTLPVLDKIVEEKISDLTKTSEILFDKIRNNPDIVYSTRINDEEKRRVRQLFSKK